MIDKIEFPAAIVDEKVYLIPSSAKLTISPINANLNPINLSNNNGTIIIYSAENSGDIDPQGLESINKLLGAVKLNPEETVLIKYDPKQPVNFNTLSRNLTISKLICFGIKAENIGLHIEYRNHIYLKFNNIDIIICDNIEGMEKPKRALLWSQLKLMYNI